ncbi:MAG: crossover junction endodeoxyribonuclease RuvC [Gammaproteobacteria bacterium]
MRILGIDPGSVKTGYGVIDVTERRIECVDYGILKLGKAPLNDRLRVIFNDIQSLIQTYQPGQMAIETVFVSRGLKSALTLGHARGAAICAAVTLDLGVAEYAPRQIKQAIVGKGGAAKQQVQYMVGMLLNIKKPIQEDAADALAVAICHQHYSESAKPLESAAQAGGYQ